MHYSHKKIFFLLLLLSSNCSFSQSAADTSKYKSLGQHTIYGELLGSSGLLYNIGYNYTLRIREKHKLAFGLGIQYLPMYSGIFGNYLFSVTPQISYLYAYEKNHHLELGVGGNYTLYNTSDNNYEHILHIPLKIGYRYQQETGGLFVSVAYTPTFNTWFGLLEIGGNDTYSWFIHPIWAGVSVGYTFK